MSAHAALAAVCKNERDDEVQRLKRLLADKCEELEGEKKKRIVMRLALRQLSDACRTDSETPLDGGDILSTTIETSKFVRGEFSKLLSKLHAAEMQKSERDLLYLEAIQNIASPWKDANGRCKPWRVVAEENINDVADLAERIQSAQRRLGDALQDLGSASARHAQDNEMHNGLVELRKAARILAEETDDELVFDRSDESEDAEA